jgi:hypothetical protein
MKASGYTNKAARSSIHIIASKSREIAPAAAREVNKLHPKIIEIKPPARHPIEQTAVRVVMRMKLT